jgi:hypothetical protein
MGSPLQRLRLAAAANDVAVRDERGYVVLVSSGHPHGLGVAVEVRGDVYVRRRHPVVARSAQWRRGDRGDHVWLLRVLAQPGGMRFDGVEFLRADTHRGWGIASMARAVARWARFS